MSRIGKQIIAIPEKVTLSCENGHIEVKGPKGQLEWDLPEGISFKEEDGSISLTRQSEKSRVQRALHGTARSLVANMVQGVSEGFVKKLEIQGVGFRAALNGKKLNLSLGFSHPVNHPIPEGLTVTVEDNTKITVEGIDKQLVGQFAAEVRAYYPPEPYKGKGVRYSDEFVRRKEGKSVK